MNEDIRGDHKNVIKCKLSASLAESLQLTSFKELRVQVRQATGNRVSKPAAADPVVRLDAQVTIERPLRGIDNGLRESREEKVVT